MEMLSFASLAHKDTFVAYLACLLECLLMVYSLKTAILSWHIKHNISEPTFGMTPVIRIGSKILEIRGMLIQMDVLVVKHPGNSELLN